MSDIAAKQCFALIALAAALTACFDVQQVDVPSDSAQTTGLLIDDFESGDSKPQSPLFLHWFCVFTNGCGVWSPGNNSRYGYYLNFELRDAQNGELDYPASGQLRTWRSGKDGLDFSHYKNLVFWAMLAPGDLGLPDSSLTVRLSCSGQGDAAGTSSPILRASSTWRAVGGDTRFRCYSSSSSTGSWSRKSTRTCAGLRLMVWVSKYKTRPCSTDKQRPARC